jgi:hypothetical protein
MLWKGKQFILHVNPCSGRVSSSSSRGGWTAYPSRAWVHVEDELLTLPEHGFTWRMTCVPFQNMGSLPVLCGFLVDQSLAFCSVFVDNYVSFYPFTFSHCIVCPSSFYGFWLLLWYLQTLLIWSYLCIIWHVYWLLTNSPHYCTCPKSYDQTRHIIVHVPSHTIKLATLLYMSHVIRSNSPHYCTCPKSYDQTRNIIVHVPSHTIKLATLLDASLIVWLGTRSIMWRVWSYDLGHVQ